MSNLCPYPVNTSMHQKRDGPTQDNKMIKIIYHAHRDLSVTWIQLQFKATKFRFLRRFVHNLSRFMMTLLPELFVLFTVPERKSCGACIFERINPQCTTRGKVLSLGTKDSAVWSPPVKIFEEVQVRQW